MRQNAFYFGGDGGIRTHVPLTDNLISSQARYDHFDTSPTEILYHIMRKKSTIFSSLYITNILLLFKKKIWILTTIIFDMKIIHKKYMNTFFDYAKIFVNNIIKEKI